VSGLLAAAKGIASMLAAIFTTASPGATAGVTIACSIPAAPAIDRVADVAEKQGERIENAIELATTAVITAAPSGGASSTPPPLNPDAVRAASLIDATARTKTPAIAPAIGQAQQHTTQTAHDQQPPAVSISFI
jgi:hypothetical protein